MGPIEFDGWPAVLLGSGCEPSADGCPGGRDDVGPGGRIPFPAAAGGVVAAGGLELLLGRARGARGSVAPPRWEGLNGETFVRQVLPIPT